MTTPLPTLDLLNLSGATILCRVDFNVPLDGQTVVDDTRIRGALPTIQHLISEGARVVVASHLGRPKGQKNPGMTLLPAAAKLAEHLETEVVFSHDTTGPAVADLIKELPPGGVLVLENLRFHPGEKANEAKFAKDLASLATVFVNDAFGTMHRSHASITGVANLLPGAVGKLVQRELEVLGALIAPVVNEEQHPFAAILGGAKVSDKIGVIDALSRRVDHLFIGGAMAYTFLAATGQAVGDSRVEEDKMELAMRLVNRCHHRGVKLHLPTDHVVAERFAENAEPQVVQDIPDGTMGLDIGPQTLSEWGRVLATCKTVFWNGPMGVFEWENFAAGTRGVAEQLASLDGTTIVGGGDSSAAVAQFNLSKDMTHISTGGGASLQFLEHGDLPGLSAIRSA